MRDLFLRLLNGLPFNNYKTWSGVIAAALVLGFEQLGYIDPATSANLLKVITLWTGLGLAHKELKSQQ